ncbi:hypothetical protein D3C81_1759200 [compost metagenome]
MRDVRVRAVKRSLHLGAEPAVIAGGMFVSLNLWCGGGKLGAHIDLLDRRRRWQGEVSFAGATVHCALDRKHRASDGQPQSYVGFFLALSTVFVALWLDMTAG